MGDTIYIADRLIHFYTIILKILSFKLRKKLFKTVKFTNISAINWLPPTKINKLKIF